MPADRRRAIGEHALVLVAYVIIFAVVALDVTHRGVLDDADPHIAHWASQSLPHWLHVWARRVTRLGDARLLGLVVAATAGWLVHRRRALEAAVLVACAAVTGGLTILLKDAFRRPRPLFLDPSGHVHSFSFPSGHASGTFSVYVLVALLLSAGRSPRTRVLSVSGALALATLVGATRVIMPVHYLTDVIAGGAVGLSVVAAGLLAHTVLRPGR